MKKIQVSELVGTAFDEAIDAEERIYCAQLLMRNPTTNTRY